MSRIEFSGEGTPIPLEALPDPSISGDVPPYALLLPPGDFLKADYEGLGYTHYEAVCIGAAGGRGGGNRQLDYMSRNVYSFGGGGGGGGLHRVAGTLAELDAATPVVVGEAGADGVDIISTKYSLASAGGLAVVDSGARPLVQSGITFINGDGSYVAPYTKINAFGEPVASNYAVTVWTGPAWLPPAYSYLVYPNPVWAAATDGADGGYSAFGDVCQASGGKGGKPTPNYSLGITVNDGFQYRPGGDGGQGGIGGTIVAGGGAAGGWTEEEYDSASHEAMQDPDEFISQPAQDGTWDGTIGKGGGGGRGGGFAKFDEIHESQNSGQGSFNYGDTSVFGPRQMKAVDPIKNEVFLPGTGGGAKISKLVVYGGRSPGASPHGAVWVRLTKIV